MSTTVRHAACLGSPTRRRPRRLVGVRRRGRAREHRGQWALPRRPCRVDRELYLRDRSTTEHRRLHQEASDFVRWGRRGGRRTLALYGRPYFSLLARFRWGHVQLEALIRAPCREFKGAGSQRPAPASYNHGVRVHNQGSRRVVEEIIGRLPELTGPALAPGG